MKRPVKRVSEKRRRQTAQTDERAVVALQAVLEAVTLHELVRPALRCRTQLFVQRQVACRVVRAPRVVSVEQRVHEQIFGRRRRRLCSPKILMMTMAIAIAGCFNFYTSESVSLIGSSYFTCRLPVIINQ